MDIKNKMSVEKEKDKKQKKTKWFQIRVTCNAQRIVGF